MSENNNVGIKISDRHHTEDETVEPDEADEKLKESQETEEIEESGEPEEVEEQNENPAEEQDDEMSILGGLGVIAVFLIVGAIVWSVFVQLGFTLSSGWAPISAVGLITVGIVNSIYERLGSGEGEDE